MKANPLARDLDKLLNASTLMRTAQQVYDRAPTSFNLDKKRKAEKEFDQVFRMVSRPSLIKIPVVRQTDLWLAK